MKMTKYQASRMLSSCLFLSKDDLQTVINIFMEKLEENGYIEKTDLEIARDYYLKYPRENHSYYADVYISRLEEELDKNIEP